MAEQTGLPDGAAYRLLLELALELELDLTSDDLVDGERLIVGRIGSLVAALQQARHACANWQREAQGEYAARKAIEAQLAVQDAALQGLEARLDSVIGALEYQTMSPSAVVMDVKAIRGQLASVRAARREVE